MKRRKEENKGVRERGRGKESSKKGDRKGLPWILKAFALDSLHLPPQFISNSSSVTAQHLRYGHCNYIFRKLFPPLINLDE